MSGDHNMNQTDSGWRKRQIALDKMAENARELGLDYNKTIMDMARESWIDVYGLGHDRQSFIKSLEVFAELVRADEREACAKIVDEWFHSLASEPEMEKIAEQIRARGQA